MSRVDSVVKKNYPSTGVRPKRVVFPLYYFYRSLRIVLVMWVLLLVVVIAAPWANYYVKKTIDGPKQAILGAQMPVMPSTASINLALPVETPTFYLKKGDLEIKAPITNGISDEDLTKGIGHHPDSVWPNQRGNVVLAGHSFSLDAENEYGQVFGKLREIDIGDQVSITYQNKKYIYKVSKKETVAANDLSLMGKSDNWILTFYTCDPPKTDWRRLVFQAELIKIE